MLPKSERQRAVEDAAKAHTDLNVFASIVAILENGSLYFRESKTAAARIIRICHAEQQKRLRDYDRAVAEANT